jgi:hypothetical protein
MKHETKKLVMRKITQLSLCFVIFSCSLIIFFGNLGSAIDSVDFMFTNVKSAKLIGSILGRSPAWISGRSLLRIYVPEHNRRGGSVLLHFTVKKCYENDRDLFLDHLDEIYNNEINKKSSGYAANALEIGYVKGGGAILKSFDYDGLMKIKKSRTNWDTYMLSWRERYETVTGAYMEDIMEVEKWLEGQAIKNQTNDFK